MITNRSVPADTILPHVVYQDVGKAIDWLARTFGFTEHYGYGDAAAPSGAQLHLGVFRVLFEKRTGSTHLTRNQEKASACSIRAVMCGGFISAGRVCDWLESALLVAPRSVLCG